MESEECRLESDLEAEEENEIPKSLVGGGSWY